MNRIVWAIGVVAVLVSACSAQTPLAPSNPQERLPPSNSAMVSGWVYEHAHASDPSIAKALIDVRYGDGAHVTALTDPEGYYQISVPAGRLTITASKEGFEAKTWELTLLEDTVLNFALIPR